MLYCSKTPYTRYTTFVVYICVALLYCYYIYAAWMSLGYCNSPVLSPYIINNIDLLDLFPLITVKLEVFCYSNSITVHIVKTVPALPFAS